MTPPQLTGHCHSTTRHRSQAKIHRDRRSLHGGSRIFDTACLGDQQVKSGFVPLRFEHLVNDLIGRVGEPFTACCRDQVH